MEYTGLLDNLPGIVYRCRCDRDWTMEFISDGCHELTGYQVSDLLNNAKLSYNDIILPEDREIVWKNVEKGVQSRQSYTLEYRIRTSAGKIKWVWEKGKAIMNAKGDVEYLEGFINDITEQKHLERIQHVVFELSKAALSASSLDDMYSTLHHELSNIIDVRNFYIAIYNGDTDTITLPYHVDYKDKFTSIPAGKSLTGYVIRTQKPLLATESDIDNLNSRGEIDIIGTPAKVWLGVPMIVNEKVFGVMAVQSYTDTEQYTAKDLELLNIIAGQIATMISRRSAEDDVTRQKAFLEQLFEASMEAILTIDNNGTVLTVNSEFTRLFGYLPHEIIGCNVDNKIANQELIDEALAVTRKAMIGSISEMETRRTHKDGHVIDVSIIVTPIRFKDEIVGAYGIYRDITDRKRIEKNLIAAKEKAEESDRLKSAFLSNMSHEIRTPMNAIIGFSTLLSDPSVTDEERQEFIRIIKERGNDLMRIMDDIIDIAKIEAGQVKIEIGECQINTLLSSLYATMNEVRKKNLKTNIDLISKPFSPDKDFTIMTDGNRLRQVLTNLIENAFKFTENGFVEYGYTFRTDEKQGPFIEFYVKDSGIGIPKDKHHVIFERFRQADDSNTRKYGGTGLGLTICKNLMSLLNGDIRLESEEGHGTTFFITLPLTGTSSPVVHKVLPKQVPEFSGLLPNKTILVVEDEDSNYFLLERILKRTDAKIVWARNGLDAINITSKGNIDLILMDIRMPVMDGYEATAEIRIFNKTIPIIAQTAYALKGEKERSLTAGCDGYISQPIDPKELLETIIRFIKPDR
ncbi:MAG: PAS domain S-box protein [Bacteroidetes bacterium]|nr:MAG: PAS domain S-box protein [Bacteroidota bacterium]